MSGLPERKRRVLLVDKVPGDKGLEQAETGLEEINTKLAFLENNATDVRQASDSFTNQKI